MVSSNTPNTLIHITHFVNPHCFHFKFHNDLLDEQLKSLEYRIADCAKDEITRDIAQTFQENDIVGAFYILWSKWIRAQVKTSAGGGGKYTLWAIDHGQHIESTGDLMYLLPDHLKNEKVNGTFQGGIYKYVPAIPELNVETFEKQMKRTENWTERAIETTKRFIANASNIFFKVKAIQRNYCFGKLSFQMANGRIVVWNQALTDLNEIAKVKFINEIEGIERKYGTEYETITNCCKRAIRFDDSISVTDGLSNVKILSIIDDSNSDESETSQSTVKCTVLDGFFKQANIIASPSPPPSTIIASEIVSGKTMKPSKSHQRKPANAGASNQNYPLQFPELQRTELDKASSIITNIQSEIEGGKTMKFSRPHPRKQDDGMRNTNYPTQSTEQQRFESDNTSLISSNVPSEIDGGITRMQMMSKMNRSNRYGK